MILNLFKNNKKNREAFMFLRNVILGVFMCSISLADTSANPKDIIITPAEKVQVSGDLSVRLKKAIEYLDLASSQQIWDGFSTGMWGADWSGRTLEAYSRASLSFGHPSSSRFDELGYGLLAHQWPDGAFHNGKANAEYEKGVGFWFGNARGMLGLLWAYEYTGKEIYKQSAMKLGDYYISDYFNDDQPGASARSDPFWWVGTEALCKLYVVTSDKKYLDFAEKVAEQVNPVRKNSQHTHSYILSLRGILQIYEQTGKQKYLDMVKGQYKYFAENVMWPGGGIVEHLGDRESYTINYWYDEGCSVYDWLGLNLDFWRITKSTEYLDMVERVALNHLLYGQDAGGGFCGDRGVDFVREGAPWPFCCAMHGARALSELTQYIAVADGEYIYVNLFYPSKTELNINNKKVQIDLATDYPNSGKLKITFQSSESVKLPLKVRIPGWSKVESASINGEKLSDISVDKGCLAFKGEIKNGDFIELEIDMPLRVEKRNKFIGDDDNVDLTKVSLWKGPRLLVYNQSLNNDLWKLQKAEPALCYVYQTYGELKFDKSVNDTPLKIGGKTYEKGLGVHSVSEIEYYLGGQFKEFQSEIGIDESAADGGAVRFKVCVDGVQKIATLSKASTIDGGEGTTEAIYGFNVTAVTGKDEAKLFKVNVENAQSIRLVVDDAVNGLTKDYADWADAKLIKKDGSVVYLSDLPDNRLLGMPWSWGKVKINKAVSVEEGGVTVLEYNIGKKTVPLKFNYLADLGYDLINNRPVLNTYMSVE